ncbi:CPBP family intramembrane metalloprotease [Brevibacterium sp. S22]|nr:CPBP family intramembrane metalloprotease [Brevibacterium sp. S22]
MRRRCRTSSRIAARLVGDDRRPHRLWTCLRGGFPHPQGYPGRTLRAGRRHCACAVRDHGTGRIRRRLCDQASRTRGLRAAKGVLEVTSPRCRTRRGLLRFGPWVGIIVSAAIFALAHGINPVLPVAFIVGIVNGILFHRTGSVWPGVVVHAFNNAFAAFVPVVLAALLG